MRQRNVLCAAAVEPDGLRLRCTRALPSNNSKIEERNRRNKNATVRSGRQMVWYRKIQSVERRIAFELEAVVHGYSSLG